MRSYGIEGAILLTVVAVAGCSEGPSWETTQLELCEQQELVFREIHPPSTDECFRLGDEEQAERAAAVEANRKS